jgi:ElaB/YqjD/DUF883 family membrane-anchored ribosome-binding protein
MKTSTNSRLAETDDPIESLKEDFAALRRDFAALVTESASERMSQATDAVKGVVKQTSKQASAVHKKLSKTAGERPVTTILVAAAVGAIGAKALWWMLRR